MKGSIERVRAFLRGDHVDRPPTHELPCNDASIACFAGEAPTPEHAAEVVYRVYEPALDATWPMVRLPERERSERLDGAGGRIMIGSSTELETTVPLENWLAPREAVIDWR